jgi:hypothetical protein
MVAPSRIIWSYIFSCRYLPYRLQLAGSEKLFNRQKIVKSRLNTFFIALLRGINVGGKNIIKMEQLKQVFDDMGFSDVKTYIQSGNVIFRT